MRQRIISLLLVALVGIGALSAQGRRGLRLNEVMIANDSTSVVDDYGRYQAWVELFNSTFGPMEISSVYLTNDSTQPKLYPVPLGDVNTEIPARQHVLFWADGEPEKGTFHTSFTFTPGQDNYIAIYDADGLTIIDEIIVPGTLKPGQSYARKADGVGGISNNADDWEIRDGSKTKYITPSSNNIIKDTNNKVDMFAEQDKNGFGMAVMAMAIVFSALLLLAICFKIISKIGERSSQRRKEKALADHAADTAHAKEQDSGEVIAAIAMALRDHLEAHDKENTVLTINKVRRSYSPWSSKIYSMREMPNKIHNS